MTRKTVSKGKNRYIYYVPMGRKTVVIHHALELDTVGDRKTAFFVIKSDTDSTFVLFIKHGIKSTI